MAKERPPKDRASSPPRGPAAAIGVKDAKGAKRPAVNRKERPASKGRVHKGRTRA